MERTQSCRAHPRHVRSSLENIKLSPQARSKISFRNFKGLVGTLDITGFRFEETIRLLEIEERGSHIGRD